LNCVLNKPVATLPPSVTLRPNPATALVVAPTFNLDPAPVAASTTTSAAPSTAPYVRTASGPTKVPLPTPNYFSVTLESHSETLKSHPEVRDPHPSRSPSPGGRDGPPWAPSMVPPLDHRATPWFGSDCHSVAIKTITIHVIKVVISITTIITYLHNYI
jgi:hypothetical protein